MDQDDTGATGSVQEPARAALESLNIADIVKGLVGDLEDLRANRITVVDARARAKLAHEIMRGIGQIVTAQKFINGALKLLPGSDAILKAARKKKSKVIDA